MVEEANKTLVRRYIQAWNEEDHAAIKQLLAPGLRYRGLQFGIAPTYEGTLHYHAVVRQAFPDITLTVEDLVVEEDKGIARLTARATHQGSFFGLPPSHRHAIWGGMHFYRVANGQIAEISAIWDRRGLLRQLGFISSAEQPAPAGPVTSPARDRVAGDRHDREAAKSLVRRLIDEVLNQGRVDVADEIVAEDFVAYPFLDGQTPGRDGIKRFAIAQLEAAPDWRITISEMIAEDDRVAICATGYGTPKLKFFGIPAAGKWLSVPWMAIYRVSNGMIKERWAEADWLGTLDQAGVLPSLLTV